MRISSNPAFTQSPADPPTALHLLDAIRQLGGHEFWSDNVELEATQSRPLMKYRQVVDLYLMKLAAAHGGVFSTLDRGADALGRSQSLPVALIG